MRRSASALLLTAMKAPVPSADVELPTRKPPVTHVTISQAAYGNMPIEGEFYATNQSCSFYLYVLKDGIGQDVATNYDVYWSSRMGDEIHEYPHSFQTPSSAPGQESINVLIRDKRDNSVGTSSADIYISTNEPLISCWG